MAEVTLKSFLDNDAAVKAARKKLIAANAALSQQKNALATAGSRISDAQRKNLENRINLAETNYAKAEDEVRKVEIARTTYFKTNQKKIQAKATTKEVSTAKQELEDVLDLMKSQPNSAILQARAADLNDRINQTGKYAPKVDTESKVVGEQEVVKPAELRNYQQEITNAANYIRKMSPADRLNLAKVLTNAGFYNGPLVNTYSDTLVNAYKTALGANYSRSTQWNEEVPWLQFLTDKITETNAAKAVAGGGGPAVPTGTVSISTPSEAASKVEAAFLRELKRLPTAQELAEFSADLIKEESKKSSITKATQKKVGGVLITEYTGGIDRDQFLSAKIRQLPEYNAAKVAAETLTIQSLAGTARANGLDLNKNFSPDVISGWAKRVGNGEDIDIFKNIIRQTAAVGMPDSVMQLMQTGVDLETIYSPYKRTMAAMLELPESSITLNDPTLRQAIGPEKPMNLYDYEKSLRKDSRWQYTKNAREEVASATLQVLRDFGFQG